MAVMMSGRYLGDLKVEMQHGPSGAVLQTAAPVDNQGDGSSFSPTDLVAAALATCMVTILGIKARQLGVDLKGCSFEVAKHMASEPRRIGRIPVVIQMPTGLTRGQRQQLEAAAKTCPVCQTLPDEATCSVEFRYPEA